jgi:hypothetical protein
MNIRSQRPVRRWIRRGMAPVVIVVMAILALVIPAGSAQAALIVWNQGNIGPTLYQTNFQYNGAVINAPAGTPSTKPITYVVVTYGYNPGTPPQAGTEAYLCISAGCIGPMGASGFTTHAFDGYPANTSFQFAYYVRQATTHVLIPATNGGTNSVQVAYNNP